jgi:uncharacterized protein (TIGR03435 family)
MKEKSSRFFIYMLSVLPAVLLLYGQEKTLALKVGDAAPLLHFEKLLQAPMGSRGSWDELKGKVVVLEFWATWCGPCRDAMPHLNELVNQFKNKPVQFISVTDEDEWRVNNFLKFATPISGWIGLDTYGAMFKAYNVWARPHTVVVDQKGKIAAIMFPNELNSDILDSVLSGQPAFSPPNQPATVSSAPEIKPKIDEQAIQPLIELLVRAAKPVDSMSMAGGSFKAKGMKLHDIISHAYNLSPVRVVAANPPSEQAYEIIAKVPFEQRDLLRPLLQQALSAAFGLKVRRETREMNVLVLTTPKNGKTLLRQAVNTSDDTILADEGLIASRSTPLRFFCSVLEENLEKIVLDETRLDGSYDISLYWDSKNPKSVIEAAKTQLGLELREGKRPVEILVYETISPSPKKQD